MVDCSNCKNYVNLYSESETYDYSIDNNGNIEYMCQECIDKIRQEYKTPEFSEMIMTYDDKTLETNK